MKTDCYFLSDYFYVVVLHERYFLYYREIEAQTF